MRCNNNKSIAFVGPLTQSRTRVLDARLDPELDGSIISSFHSTSLRDVSAANSASASSGYSGRWPLWVDGAGTWSGRALLNFNEVAILVLELHH